MYLCDCSKSHGLTLHAIFAGRSRLWCAVSLKLSVNYVDSIVVEGKGQLSGNRRIDTLKYVAASVAFCDCGHTNACQLICA